MRRGWVYRFAGVGHRRLSLSLNSFRFRFRSGTLPRFMGTAHSTPRTCWWIAAQPHLM